MSFTKPKQVAKKVFYEGKSVIETIKMLSSAMDRLPVLTKEQIYGEYEHLMKESELYAFNPSGLHGGLVSEVKKTIKNQLLADRDWLTEKKISFEVMSFGWEALVTTYYIRPPVTLPYRSKLWRGRRDDEREIYYYCFSERNW